MMMMKRKELDDVNDNFSDFSLSSPARKIRRLNAELPPIIEEQEPDIPMVFSQSKENSGGVSSVVIEELGIPDDNNEERAIVLFNPINNSPPPLVHSPSSYSFSVSPNFLSGFKNQVLWSSQSNLLKAADDKTDEQVDARLGPNNGCLAVVPWVPMHSHSSPAIQEVVPQMDVCEMDADEPEASTMEIEDNGCSFDQRPAHEFGGMGVSEGLNQWQQHCMISQFPQNLSPPVTWFR